MDNLLYFQEVKKKSKTAVILLTYRRLEYFYRSSECLINQTNKDFDFYISNNSDKKDKLVGLVKKFLGKSDINIYVKDYNNEFKPFSRFIMAQDLALEGYEKIIFIDDDEIFSPQFIQDCYDQYEETSVKTFWAHKIEKVYKRKIKLEGNELGNYAGPGGLVCSSKVFLGDELFDCPEKYWIVDDLWLSYYLIKFTNYKIKTLKTNINFIKDAKATFLTLGNLKQEFSDEFILPESKHLSVLV
jgi:glycosyltransferase involved in cell wall biosynthesis